MKKLFILSVVFLSASSIGFAQAGKTKKDEASQQLYTCTMHPEVRSSKMGKCPKCGMELVPIKGNHHMDSSMHKMPMHKKDSSMHKMPV